LSAARATAAVKLKSAAGADVAIVLRVAQLKLCGRDPFGLLAVSPGRMGEAVIQAV
jgi:hypothetical protein